ncbi:MAG TPA: MFS transporter [Vicinamibacterales bacterium]|jgi:ACS family hexuronate transporter-like MFS transporter|nr:MFS transporter [Vicinamibacterales bacterium]
MTGRVRWGICALLFFAATINYVDRQVLGILKPTLQQQLGWSEVAYGVIVGAFQLAYAIGLLLAGRIVDRVGTRLGFALAIALWSVAAIAHAAAVTLGVPASRLLAIGGLTVSASAAGFVVARFALGLGEAANFPAGIKAIAEWFPRRERAFAAGLFNAGTNIGAIAAPLAVPLLTLRFGWQWAFIATGLLGFLWLAVWWRSYADPDRHPRVSAQELALIHSDPPESDAPIRWRVLLPLRQTWAFGVGKLLTDPVWWIYLFWIPDFLNRRYGLDLTSVGVPLIVIFVSADAGSVAGGWCSSRLIRGGMTVNRARKTAMFACAIAVTPIVFAARTTHLWTAVALISLAAAAHQGWSSNLYTLCSDMFPRRAVASVVGAGGALGALSGTFASQIVAAILQATGSYASIFTIASCAYLVALACVHALAPQLEPAETIGGPVAVGRSVTDSPHWQESPRLRRGRFR